MSRGRDRKKIMISQIESPQNYKATLVQLQIWITLSMMKTMVITFYSNMNLDIQRAK